MTHEFKHPIIGQEAICPDGLGRVTAFIDNFPTQWIRVSTYVGDKQCNWAPYNIKLIKLAIMEQADAKSKRSNG